MDRRTALAEKRRSTSSPSRTSARYLDEQREATGGVLPDRSPARGRALPRRARRLAHLRAVAVRCPCARAVGARGRGRRCATASGSRCRRSGATTASCCACPRRTRRRPPSRSCSTPTRSRSSSSTRSATAALFAARFRENAARALLLPRRRPGSAHAVVADAPAGGRPARGRVAVRLVPDPARDLPRVPAATCSTCRPSCRSWRRAGRRVRVVSVDTQLPSPFASSLAFAYVASFMYEGDAPLAERRAQALTLDRRMLAELVGSRGAARAASTRTRWPRSKTSCRRSMSARWARTVDAAHDLLLRLGDLSRPSSAPAARAPTSRDVARGRAPGRPVRIAGEDRLIAAEDARPLPRRARVCHRRPVFPTPSSSPSTTRSLQLVGRWARTHGPFLAAEPAHRFGLGAGASATTLLADRARRDAPAAGRVPPRRQRARVVRRRGPAPSASALARRAAPRGRAGRRHRARPLPARVARRRHRRPGHRPALRRRGAAPGRSHSRSRARARRAVGTRARLLAPTARRSRGRGRGDVGRRRSARSRRRQGRAVPARAGRRCCCPTPAGRRAVGARSTSACASCCPHAARASSATCAATTTPPAIDALWDLVWAGEVTNDSFAPLRALSPARARPRGRARADRPRPGSPHRPRPAQGAGPLVAGRPRGVGRGAVAHRSGPMPARRPCSSATACSRARRRGARARPVGSPAVYPVLRAMEEAGRVRRGYFVAGLGGRPVRPARRGRPAAGAA